MSTTPEFFGQQVQQSAASEFNTFTFICRQLINKTATAMLVKVKAVSNEGELSPVGTVSVLPLVNQLSGDGQAVPHLQLVNVPYFRLQGGADAVILDPKVGDIGLAIFCMRDISAVKTAKDVANPGSARKYDWADGLYIGGYLNGTPTQFVQFSAEGVRVVSPTKIRLEAPTIELAGNVDQMGGNVTMAQDLDVTGEIDADGQIHSATDVFADTISGKTHTHGGITPGGGTTAPPNP